MSLRVLLRKYHEYRALIALQSAGVSDILEAKFQTLEIE